jgi:hypothetical protein
MPTIVEHKPHNVTIGVLDKSLKLFEDLQSVTFRDIFGTPHTVYAHVNGPFQTAEQIVAAHADGILHTLESHEAAAALARDKGEHEFADRLDALAKRAEPAGGTQNGGAS